ncbi:MAG TPA: DUF4258 domain-containing protein [Longimicrobium sp.]|nr:DUF4258 domain-containing protein [Longimicrobium sp.]
MNLIAEIRRKVADGQFVLSRHATDQSLKRGISVSEVLEALSTGEVIEDYPDDKYGPSCLIFGISAGGRPLHIQCSYPSRPTLKFITVYEPDPALWIEFRLRKR